MSAGVGRKTACVTGGSGYIASALVKTLLEKGYAVKTTVRDPEGFDRGCCPRDSERDEVVRESRDGEAGDPDVLGRRGVQTAAAGRRARAGRGLLVRRCVPQSPQATHLGLRGVEGAARAGGGRVRAGERHQPRHRAAGVHPGRPAGLQGQEQRPGRPLLVVRRRGAVSSPKLAGKGFEFKYENYTTE